MRLRIPIACVFVAGALPACTANPPAGTLLTIEAEGNGRPFTAILEWLGPKGSILPEQQVPEHGTFPLRDRELATVFIESGGATGMRRALLVGRIDAKTFWGAARVELQAGTVVEAKIIMREAPLEASDLDGDRVPDEIDDCDDRDDRLGC